MKHIIFSTYDDYTSEVRGGTAIAIHEVAKRLTKKYSVTIIVARRDLSSDAIIDSVCYKHIGISFGDMRFRQLVYLFLLPWYATFKRYDVWIEAFTGPTSTAFLPIFTRKPVIGVTHFFNGDEMRKKYKLPFDLIEKFGIKTFKYLVTLTEFQEKKALRMNQNLKVKIIPNGVDENLFSLQKDDDANTLLYMGRIDMQTKGLDILLDSVKILFKDERNDTKLIICGKGGKSEELVLHDNIEYLGLRTSATFIGYVSGDRKYSCLKKCAVFLAPSRFETFGGSMLEAMASALPVVIFDLPCYSWIPRDCIVRVQSFDTQKYSEAILYLLNHPKEREEIGCRAREFAKGFSWNESARKYVEYIEEVTK